MTRYIMPVLMGFALLLNSGAQAQSLTEVRTKLQVALQRSLSRAMVDGALPHLDLETGEITKLYPTENHEVILRMNDIYVLCATLVTADGTESTVEYYIAQNRGSYGVIRTEIDNHAPIQSLIAAGKAIRLE
ncbi:hypothetical protein SAMN05444414_102103 [Roseovarius marisflavi]|uniref:Uncharacterized protein n=1 Tax=Roseovarius marisflavi TaxID=1054996 RepID=A0A1M6W433_9RHOB|nr:hypothetical protein [Roseovarius marisflavi]SHK88490.1 hypothetical protein SAMN05444414_102103 [Roseovarius marisflavi]